MKKLKLKGEDGTIYDEGVILPKQDPNASDTAIISLPAEFLVYHQDEKGFGEIRDYTPYYAKKRGDWHHRFVRSTTLRDCP